MNKNEHKVENVERKKVHNKDTEAPRKTYASICPPFIQTIQFVSFRIDIIKYGFNTNTNGNGNSNSIRQRNSILLNKTNFIDKTEYRFYLEYMS